MTITHRAITVSPPTGRDHRQVSRHHGPGHESSQQTHRIYLPATVRHRCETTRREPPAARRARLGLRRARAQPLAWQHAHARTRLASGQQTDLPASPILQQRREGVGRITNLLSFDVRHISPVRTADEVLKKPRFLAKLVTLGPGFVALLQSLEPPAHAIRLKFLLRADEQVGVVFPDAL